MCFIFQLKRMVVKRLSTLFSEASTLHFSHLTIIKISLCVWPKCRAAAVTGGFFSECSMFSGKKGFCLAFGLIALLYPLKRFLRNLWSDANFIFVEKSFFFLSIELIFKTSRLLKPSTVFYIFKVSFFKTNSIFHSMKFHLPLFYTLFSSTASLTEEKEQKMCESLSKENEIVAVYFPLEKHINLLCSAGSIDTCENYGNGRNWEGGKKMFYCSRRWRKTGGCFSSTHNTTIKIY